MGVDGCQDGVQLHSNQRTYLPLAMLLYIHSLAKSVIGLNYLEM